MTAEQIINEWNSDIKQDLIKNYERLGLRASGNWAESLEEFNNRSQSGFVFGILGEEYTGAIESGRSPNLDQDPDALKRWVGWAGNTIIKQWVEDKGLSISPFAVAWKIAREGWSVPNRFNAGGLVSDVVTDKRIAELKEKLSLYFVGEIKSSIIKSLKK